MILRRPPVGSKAKNAHDMRREYDVQLLLKPVFDYVPAMVAFCGDENIIGSEFYVMERLNGNILRHNLPSDITLSKQQARALSRTYVDRLIDLHQVDVTATGLDTFSRGQGYVARQVAGWSDRYRKARTTNVGSFENVKAWLEANQPDDRGQCIIHNDYRLDNLVLDPEDPLGVIGILDWEMATVGDPLMDLGSALAYWIEAKDNYFVQQFRRQPSNVAGMLTRTEIVAYYAAQTGQIHTRSVALLRGVRLVPARRDRPTGLLPLLPRPDHQPRLQATPLGGPHAGMALFAADQPPRRGIPAHDRVVPGRTWRHPTRGRGRRRAAHGPTGRSSPAATSSWTGA